MYIYSMCEKCCYLPDERSEGGKTRKAITIMQRTAKLVDSHLAAMTGSWSCRYR
jgi:hypothetical protein